MTRSIYAATMTIALLLLAHLSPPASADIFDDLKKAAEQAVSNEIQKAVDGQSKKEEPIQEADPTIVVEAQSYLSYMGYDVGPISGQMTAQTIRAIQAYQLDVALPPDGILTDTLRTMIITSARKLSTTGVRPSPATPRPGQPTVATQAPVATQPAPSQPSPQSVRRLFDLPRLRGGDPEGQSVTSFRAPSGEQRR